tara:strand:- start:803 stop:1201 length:399 start_codon:yes stop_codon:yes gene_type:complete
MENLSVSFFEPLREHFKHPIDISSFYRSKKLNKRIGGASKSDHMTGEAIDLDRDKYSTGPSNAELFHYIKDNLRYYKLIAEFPKDGNPGWIHISYMKEDSLNDKKIAMIAVRSKGKTSYLPYKGHEYKVNTK